MRTRTLFTSWKVNVITTWRRERTTFQNLADKFYHKRKSKPICQGIAFIERHLRQAFDNSFSLYLKNKVE